MVNLTGGARILRQTQVRFQKKYSDLAKRTSDRITNILVQAAGADGIIEWENRHTPVAATRALILRMFTNENGQAFGDDGVSPMAEYPRILNEALANSQFRSIELQSKYIERFTPPDILQWLKQGDSRQDAQAQFQTSADNLLDRFRYIFVRSQSLDYDPAHTFVDPNGYVLSDRIWLTSQRVRNTIDRILLQSIQEGVGAVETARRLERSLQPSRLNIRTSGRRVIQTERELRIQRLYWGRRASYDAMRLARTEITAAIGRSQIATAKANPYTDKIRWTLSPNHPEPDICDDLQGEYIINNLPAYPAHPHCLCYLTPVQSRPRREVIDDIRNAYQRNQEGDPRFQPLVNPSSLQPFSLFLLGTLLRYLTIDI